jgi:mannose-1-phosphate guanylyltransferase
MKVQSYNRNSLFSNSPTRNVLTGSDAGNRWAVILAGAADRFPNGLTPAWMRGQRPKQFTRSPGSDIVINQTRAKTALVFPPEKTLFVVSRDHKRYYEEVLADVPAENLIVQPQDDGSVFAVLYAALRLNRMNPSAILAFFPADLQVGDARQFMTQVDAAASAVSRQPNLILLGTKAESAGITGREWIEHDPNPVNENFNVWRVRRFLHRATPHEARQLLSKGALWNTSVMVGTASTFLRKIRRAAPDVFERFSEAASKIGTPGEGRAIEKAYYSNYRDTDFSRDVLAKSSGKLFVIPVPGPKRSAVGVKPTFRRRVPERVVTPPPALNYRLAKVGL